MGGDSELLGAVVVEALAIAGLGALYLNTKQKLSSQEEALAALLTVRRSLQRLQLDTTYSQTSSISGGSKDEETLTEASLAQSAEPTLQDAML